MKGHKQELYAVDVSERENILVSGADDTLIMYSLSFAL
jgi:hypothetical protein